MFLKNNNNNTEISFVVSKCVVYVIKNVKKYKRVIIIIIIGEGEGSLHTK